MNAIKENKIILLFAVAVFIISIVNNTISASASFVALDTAAMTRMADVIVIGQIKEVQPAYKGIKFTKEIRDKLKQKLTEAEAQFQEEDESNTIHTNVIIKVDKYLKTDSAVDANKKEITIRLLGGTVKGVTMKVPGFPYFEKKDENQPVLLFLGRSFDDVLEPFSQGTFRIRNNRAVNNNFPDQNLGMPEMLDKIEDNTYFFGLYPIFKIVIAVIAVMIVAFFWKHSRHFKQ